MHVTVRSYLTAGVAAVGAGAIAITPVQPMPGQDTVAQTRAVSNIAVTLASTIDPITPWVDTFKAAAKNIEIMHFAYWETPPVPGPFPIISSIIFNQYTYAQELFNGQGAKIPGQIANNFKTFFEVQRQVNLNTLDGLHNVAWGLLPSFITIPPNLQPLLDLTTTWSSGQFLGLFTPPLASLVQLTRSFTAVGEFFKNGDVIGAINELLNIPANTTNAFLNGGQVLDLTNIVSSLLPKQITKIGIALGGLLSPGGSAFNALDLVTKPFAPAPPTVAIPGVPAGILTSSILLGRQIGEAIDVGPFVPSAAAAPAAAKPAPAAAAVSAPEASAPAVAPEAPAVAPEAPAVAPEAPAVAPEAPAPAVVDIPAVEAPAPQAVSAPEPAVADTPVPAHRGGGDNGGSDNSGHSGARGHRGAA